MHELDCVSCGPASGTEFFDLVHAGSVQSGPVLSHCVLSGQGLAKPVWSGPYLIFVQLRLDLLYATHVHLTRTSLGSRTSSWVPVDLDLELSVDFCSTPALAALMTIGFCSKKKTKRIFVSFHEYHHKSSHVNRFSELLIASDDWLRCIT